MSNLVVDLDDHEVIELTTTGRQSGRPHRIEIWFAHHQTTLYVLSDGGDRSDWVRNIIANPAVIVHANDTSYAGLARIVVDPGERRVAIDHLVARYTRQIQPKNAPIHATDVRIRQLR